MEQIRQAKQWIRDAGTILVLCFRLLISKRWIWVFLVFAGFFYTLLLSGLTEAAEEETRIPLAVVSNSEQIQKREAAYLRELSVLQIVETGEEEGFLALRQGDVAAVLVIEDGFEDWLLEGIRPTGSAGTWKPLTLYVPEGQEEQKILAELIAGRVLERYCLYRSYAFYQEQEGLSPVSLEEYEATAKRYQEEESSGEFLQIYYETPAAVQKERGEPGREAIYLQVVLGMLTGLLLLFALLLVASGGEPGMPDRSGAGLIGKSATFAGNFLYVLCLELAVGILLVTVFFWKGSVYRTEGSPGIAGRLPAAFWYLFLFALVISLLFLLLREGAGSRERFLPLGMAVFAGLTVLGLVRVAASFLPDTIETVIRFSPGGWLIDRMLALLYQ